MSTEEESEEEADTNAVGESENKDSNLAKRRKITFKSLSQIQEDKNTPDIIFNSEELKEFIDKVNDENATSLSNIHRDLNLKLNSDKFKMKLNLKTEANYKIISKIQEEKIWITFENPIAKKEKNRMAFFTKECSSEFIDRLLQLQEFETKTKEAILKLPSELQMYIKIMENNNSQQHKQIEMLREQINQLNDTIKELNQHMANQTDSKNQNRTIPQNRTTTQNSNNIVVKRTQSMIQHWPPVRSPQEHTNDAQSEPMHAANNETDETEEENMNEKGEMENGGEQKTLKLPLIVINTEKTATVRNIIYANCQEM